MTNTISVMNAKGGVGKSTLVLALAETLSVYHGKRVLIIDSDTQASVSSMLMAVPDLHKLQNEEATIVDYLVDSVLRGQPADWRQYVIDNVSDVDDAQTIHLIASDMQLTLFEREVSREGRHSGLRMAIGRLLREAEDHFDIILVDCPPGLSILTECWLRETRYHISPTKADYISICGLEVFRRFKLLNPEMGFAENLGVIVNMRSKKSLSEDEYHNWLLSNDDNRCFKQAIPCAASLQDAVRFDACERSYYAKYPGHVGEALRQLSKELVVRLEVQSSHDTCVPHHSAGAVGAA